MKITKNENAVTKREFIGRAWINKVKKEGKNHGVEFISVRLDQAYETIQLDKGDRLLLWPNNKREGKQDADYRVSVVSDEAQA
jgi:uncharacterized protein (DUF736 family)